MIGLDDSTCTAGRVIPECSASDAYCLGPRYMTLGIRRATRGVAQRARLLTSPYGQQVVYCSAFSERALYGIPGTDETGFDAPASG